MAERNPVGRLLTTRWLFVILYIAVIFVLSAQPALKFPVGFLFKDKVVHALEYAGLSALVYGAARGSWPGFGAVRRVLLTTLGIGALGVADELFQSTVPGRDSSPFDWLADVVGASLVQCWCLAREMKRGRA